MSDLLEKALAAHGGLELWRGLRSITADMKIGGALFERKGQRESLRSTTLVIDPHRPHSVYTPIGAPGLRGVYEGDDRVAIETDDGRVLEERRAPRSKYDAFAPEEPWDLLHLMYFCGYAAWNYLTTPFIFTYPGFQVNEIDPWDEGGETWRRLHVIFSPDIPTHCPEQTFYFDEGGLLRRLDYHSEVIASLPAAHYLYDHKAFSGLVMPTKRRALRRLPDNTSSPAPVFVELEFTDIRLA